MTTVGGAGENVWLPDGAPAELRDFVDGKSSSVEIDTAAVDWLPPAIDTPVLAEPSVSIRAGSTPTAVTLEIAWSRAGPAKSVFEVLIVDGKLEVSSHEFSTSAARRLSEWVDAVNHTLVTSDRHLHELRVQGPILIVTTRSPLTPPRNSSTTPVPVALAGLLALRRPPTPVAPWHLRTRATKLLSVTAIVLLFCGGAVLFASTLGDDPPTTGPATSTTDPPNTTSTEDTTDTTDTTTQVECTEGTLVDGVCVQVGPPTTTLPPDGSTPVNSTDSSVPDSTDSSVPDSTDSSVPDSTDSSVPDPTGPTTNQIACTTGTLPDGSCVTVRGPGPPQPTGKKALPLTTVPGADPPVECFENDLGARDTDGDGVPDECVDFYLDEATSAGPPLPTTRPTGTLAVTGSDGGVPLQLGIVLILAGLIALVAAHRRASDENLSITTKEGP